MAEIYRQQIEHRTTGPVTLKQSPFKDYFTQGLNSVAEGLNALDSYMEDKENRQLTDSMNALIQESTNVIDQWPDFNTDGRHKLTADLMEQYDKILSSAPAWARNRFNDANPESRKIFELKINQQILKKANEQIFAEKERVVNGLANRIAFEYRDPEKAQQMIQLAIDEEINNNPEDLLSVKQLGYLSDQLHRTASQGVILQAIADGDVDRAKQFLGNQYFRKTLSPSDLNTLTRSVAALENAEKKDEKKTNEAKEIGLGLVDVHDSWQKKFGADVNPVNGPYVRSAWQRAITNLANGQSIDNIYVDPEQTIPVSALVDQNTVNWFRELPLSTRQLAVNEANKVMKDVYPNYDFLQSKLSTKFLQLVSPFRDEYGNIDVSKMTVDSMRDISNAINDLSAIQYGLSSSMQAEIDFVRNAFDNKRDRAAKAISVENFPIQQERSGVWHGIMGAKDYTGNLTKLMADRIRSGDSNPSFLEALYTQATNKYNSDFSYMMNETMMDYMREMGEVDEDGDLVMPKPGTYRYMTYAIPVLFSMISNWGNEDDLKKTGIGRDRIDKGTTVDFTLALQNVFADYLDEVVDNYNAYNTNKEEPADGEYTTDSPVISKSKLYQMVMMARDVAVRQGLAQGIADEGTMINITHAIRSLVAGDTFWQSLGRMFDKSPSELRKSSGVRQKIEEKTPKVFSKRGITNE